MKSEMHNVFLLSGADYRIFCLGGSHNYTLYIDCKMQPEKGMYFLCFLLFWEFFNCYNFVTTSSFQEGFSQLYLSSPNEHFNGTENLKMLHVRF